MTTSDRVKVRQRGRRDKLLSMLELKPRTMAELISEIDYSKPTIMKDIKYLNNNGYNINYDPSMKIYRIDK